MITPDIPLGTLCGPKLEDMKSIIPCIDDPMQFINQALFIEFHSSIDRAEQLRRTEQRESFVF